jgi:Protein of unknown function
MDQEQADEIQEHLLDAAFALDEARAAIAALGNDNQNELAAYLAVSVDKLETALHSKLLRAIYDQFPDLIRSNEFPEISSALPWNRVHLPPSISEADIDAILLSVMTPRLQKVAMVIGRAIERCEELGMPISPEILGVRVHALVEADRVEGKGDTRRWRFSEVRLKG